MRLMVDDERANEEDFMWAMETFLKRILIIGYIALFGITLYILINIEAKVECLATE